MSVRLTFAPCSMRILTNSTAPSRAACVRLWKGCVDKVSSTIDRLDVNDNKCGPYEVEFLRVCFAHRCL
jgi:hypothetical protein